MPMRLRTFSRTGSSKTNCVAAQRGGTVVTELAVCIPLIVLVVFSTIEICSMIFLRQSLRICAFEGSRVALVQGSEEGNVIAACQEFLDSRKIKSTNIEVNPANFPDLPYGTIVSVKVTADCTANSLVPIGLYNGKTLTGEVKMMLERD